MTDILQIKVEHGLHRNRIGFVSRDLDQSSPDTGYYSTMKNRPLFNGLLQLDNENRDLVVQQ